MADVWANSMACHSGATYHIIYSAGQGKFAGQRPTFYHCATQLTLEALRDDVLYKSTYFTFFLLFKV